MQYYGIMGGGDAKKRVIEDSLKDYTDRAEKAVALVPWLGPPTGGMETSLDWLIDNEMPFQVIFEEGEKPPPRAVEKVADEVIETRDPVRYILKELAKEGGDLLFLFDPDAEDESNVTVFAAFDAEVPVLELNNGLAPLIVETEPEPEERRPVPGKDTAEPLSEAEIRAMSAADLRAYAKNTGLNVTGLKKADLLKLLLEGPPEDTEEEETAPAAPAEEPPLASAKVAPGTATIVVTFADGLTIVRPNVDINHQLLDSLVQNP